MVDFATYALPHAAPELLVVDVKGVLHRSVDGGQHWSVAQTPTPGRNNVVNRIHLSGATLVVETSNNQIYQRIDAERWRDLGRLPHGAKVVAVVAGNNETLLAATSSGLFRHYRDTPWKLMESSSGWYFSALIAGSDPHEWLATTRETAVLRSRNDGESWRRIGYGMRKVDQADAYAASHFSVLKRAGPNQLYLGGFSGLLESSDRAETWRELLTLEDQSVMAVAHVSGSDTVFLAYQPSGLWRSNDAGASFTQV